MTPALSGSSRGGGGRGERGRCWPFWAARAGGRAGSARPAEGVWDRCWTQRPGALGSVGRSAGRAAPPVGGRGPAVTEPRLSQALAAARHRRPPHWFSGLFRAVLLCGVLPMPSRGKASGALTGLVTSLGETSDSQALLTGKGPRRCFFSGVCRCVSPLGGASPSRGGASIQERQGLHPRGAGPPSKRAGPPSKKGQGPPSKGRGLHHPRGAGDCLHPRGQGLTGCRPAPGGGLGFCLEGPWRLAFWGAGHQA